MQYLLACSHMLNIQDMFVGLWAQFSLKKENKLYQKVT